MKRILSLILILIFVSGSFSVFAEEELSYATVEPTQFAETYIDNTINLFSSEKTLEQTLVEGWENLSEKISIKDYDIAIADIGNVYRGILYNNPMLYYVNTGFSYSYSTSGTVAYVYPKYSETDITVISDTLDAINEATEEIMLCLDESMTDFEKIMTVHDYMVLHYEYDYTLKNHNITIMTTKKGVCMAYSMAFKHIMNKLGIECLYVTGAKEMNHGWNIVKLDDEWYHIDLTWDDSGSEFGQVKHKFALLSDKEIQSMEKPHYGYDLNGLQASSNKYDKVKWHEDNGSIITINKIYYYVDDNNLVDQNGKIIYKNLNGDGYWDIGGNGYFPVGNYTGLAEHNGILYFNTDQAIYSYNPKKEEVTKLLDYEGLCGLFIDKNTLFYCKFDITARTFVEAGEYKLGKIRFGGTFHENGKIVKRIYKEADAKNINVFARCDDCVKVEKIEKAGYSTIKFDEKECQTLFYWTDDLRPLKEKEVYNQ